MKIKILITSFIIMFTINAICTNVYAEINSSAISISADKETYTSGEEVVVTFSLDSLNADKGIVSYGATLDYDESTLELIDISGEGKWDNPSYNEDNGKFVSTRSDYSSLTGEKLCKFKFKAIKDAKEGTKITLKDITIANGGNRPANCNNVETSVKIGATEKPSNPDDDNKNTTNTNTANTNTTNTNNNGGNNNSGNNNSGNNNGGNNNGGNNNSGSSNNDNSKGSSNTLSMSNNNTVGSSNSNNTSPNIIPYAGDIMPVVALGLIIAIIALNVLLIILNKYKERKK